MKILNLIIIYFLMCTATWAQNETAIKLSVKVFLNPVTGGPPIGYTDGELEDIIEEMNILMTSYRRGMVFRLEEVIHLGGVDDILSEAWFSRTIGKNGRQELEEAAEASPLEYEWREDAINIYLNGATVGLAGACSFSHFDFDEIVFIRVPGGFNAKIFLHELGHFFDLMHTHVSANPDSCNTPLPLNMWTPGDDDLDDTLEDHHCWTKNNMSQYHFNLDFDSLSTENQKLVDDTYYNIMSYHNDKYSLTEEQMNKWADRIRIITTRDVVVQGTVYYVNKNSSICTSGVDCSGRPNDEFLNVDDALDKLNASGGDVIVTRVGTYDISQNIISQPLLLLATREGDVILK